MSDIVLRLSNLDFLVRTGQTPTVSDITKQNGHSERTTYRDIDLMRYSFGAPLEYCPQAGGFVYTEAYKWPALCLVQACLDVASLLESHPMLACRSAFAHAFQTNTLAEVYPYAEEELHRTRHSHRGRGPQWYSTLAYQEFSRSDISTYAAPYEYSPPGMC